MNLNKNLLPTLPTNNPDEICTRRDSFVQFRVSLVELFFVGAAPNISVHEMLLLA